MVSRKSPRAPRNSIARSPPATGTVAVGIDCTMAGNWRARSRARQDRTRASWPRDDHYTGQLNLERPNRPSELVSAAERVANPGPISMRCAARADTVEPANLKSGPFASGRHRRESRSFRPGPRWAPSCREHLASRPAQWSSEVATRGPCRWPRAGDWLGLVVGADCAP